jgi:hypothetical protein
MDPSSFRELHSTFGIGCHNQVIWNGGYRQTNPNVTVTVIHLPVHIKNCPLFDSQMEELAQELHGRVNPRHIYYMFAKFKVSL